jgi:hypothetical protein
LQGDIGCDIRFNDTGTQEILCHSGTAPQLDKEGCDLASNVPVRWEGKLWLTPHNLNPSHVNKVIIATSLLWQESRSQTRPYSPSILESADLSASNSHNTDTLKLTPDNSASSSKSRLTISDEATTDTTTSSSDSSSDKASDSKSDPSLSKSNSAELSEDLSSSGSRSHSPSLPTANATGDGITELYYMLNRKLSKIMVNTTSYINETLLSTLTISTNNPAYSPTDQIIYWLDYTAGCCNSNELRILNRGIISENQITSTQSACTFQYLGNSITSYYVSPDTNDLFMGRGGTGMGGTLYWALYNHQSNTCTQTERQIQSGPGMGISNYPNNLYYNSLAQKLLVTYGITYLAIWDFNATAPTAQLKNLFFVYNTSGIDREAIESMAYDHHSKELYIQFSYNSSIRILKKAPFDFGNPTYLTNFRTLNTFSPYLGEIIGIRN